MPAVQKRRGLGPRSPARKKQPRAGIHLGAGRLICFTDAWKNQVLALICPQHAQAHGPGTVLLAAAHRHSALAGGRFSEMLVIAQEKAWVDKETSEM